MHRLSAVIQTQVLAAENPAALEQAIAILHAGGVVAFPTDTVYGLAANLQDEQAVETLYQVKGREATKAIAALIGDLKALEGLVKEFSPAAQRLAARFWPGPLTLVLPSHANLPGNLSPQPTIGVRMPDHPTALALLMRTGPLGVTSANRSGAPSALTAGEVLEQLDGLIPLIIDGGRTPGGQPSTVVDCTGPQLVILRQGPLSLQDLLAVL